MGVWVLPNSGIAPNGEPLNGPALGGPLTIVDNHISENTIAGVENDSTVTVNADYNWWGSASGPTNSGNTGGTGNTIIDSALHPVTFAPWLTSGTDTQAGTPGFQPAASVAVSISGSPSGVEGAIYTLTLSPSSLSDTAAWSVNWHDGPGNTDNIQTGIAGDATSVTHVFAEEGSYAISAVAHTVSSGDVTANSTVTVVVGDATLTAGTVSALGGVEGVTPTSLSATFSDANAGAPAGGLLGHDQLG